MSTAPAQPQGDVGDCPKCGQQVAIPHHESPEELPCPRCRQLLWFVRKNAGGVVILTFLPGLTIGRESVERVEEVIGATGDAPGVLLDFSLLRFLSSLFLGMLIRVHLRLASAQRTLKLCGLRPEARDVFRVTKLDQVFELHADQQSALRAYPRTGTGTS